MAMVAEAPEITKPLRAHLFNGKAQPQLIPDIIEFVTSPEYLNRALYPRQATLLKVIFLQTELLTDYDYRVIAEWTSEFSLPAEHLRDEDKPLVYEGQWGMPPDVLERMDTLRAEGHLWFREVLAVIGRRGSKGYIGGLCGAYILWHYVCLGDPQDHYAIDRDKRLAALVFAGKKAQAKQNQWRDLVNVIIGAPCFSVDGPFGNLVSQALAETLTVMAPADAEKIDRLKAQGIRTTMDQSTFEIIPKESTPMAGRGVAGFLLMFDEMAHVVATGASRSAGELYESAEPALDQFGNDGFVYAGSSPWEMIGKFYELCQQALEVEHDTTDPVHHDKLLIQLTSWDIYVDWERAHEIPMVPRRWMLRCAREGNQHGRRSSYHAEVQFDAKGNPRATRPRCFAHIKKPVLTYNARMKRLERANPETFAVERRSRWAAALDTYLKAEHVDRMFQPWPEGRNLTMQTRGILKRTYIAHGDPSKSGANFGWAIAHAEGPDADGLRHVVFDKIHFWAPYHFENGEVDYIEIGKEIGDDIEAFMPSMVSFDQFNSVEIMQRLRKRARAANMPKHVDVFERTATAPLNWRVAETFKTALNLHLVHCPYFEQLELEAKFLQVKGNKVDHPGMGPVQTKDVWDAVAIVTYVLIGDQLEGFLRDEFRAAGISGSGQGMGGRDDQLGNVSSAAADQETFNALSSSARRRHVSEAAMVPAIKRGRR
jgi:hypothetical protein